MKSEFQKQMENTPTNTYIFNIRSFENNDVTTFLQIYKFRKSIACSYKNLRTFVLIPAPCCTVLAIEASKGQSADAALQQTEQMCWCVQYEQGERYLACVSGFIVIPA